MKKRLSTAALALRLTAMPVFGVMLLTAVVQIGLFARTEHMWALQEDSWTVLGFERIVDGEGIALVGKIGFVLMLAVILWRCAGVGSRSVYTLRRMRIGENEITAIWAAVFAGYFLIGWAVQLALVLGMFVPYARASGDGAIELFVAAYRSAYFHTLLPLAEGWGYARNVALCVGWGGMCSMIARHTRHGGRPGMAIALIVLTGWFLPREMASEGTDTFVCVLMVMMLAGQYLMTEGGKADED